MNIFARGIVPTALLLAGSRGADSQDGPPATPPARVESIDGPDGRRLPGKLVGDTVSGFGFRPDGDQTARSLEKLDSIAFEGPGPAPASATPPFHVELGLGQRISGRLGVVTESELRLEDGPGRRTVTIARPAVQALLQRPGEVQVFQEGFETLDPKRWVVVGEPVVADEPKLAGAHALRLPAGGSAVTCRLPEPIGSGRLEVAFLDEGRHAPGQRWFVDLTFRGPSGDEWVRALLGWEEESLAVQSSPGGPALAVQRLARRAGWHRLSVRFGPERTDLTVDGDELARGLGAAGPLIEVRLATQSSGRGAPPEGLAVAVDDLRLARLAEPVGGLEVDPRQDEVRLVGGDQLFGRLTRADAERATLTVLGQAVSLPWAEVSGLHFRRTPSRGRDLDGLWVRLEWRSAPGGDPRDLDSAEGTLTAISDDSVELSTPYAGTLVVPRDRLHNLRVLGHSRRIVLDPTTHHLGNEVVRDLDPPQPEGRSLAVPFTLDQVPEGPVTLAVDVLQVAGEAEILPFSAFVKEGELRTNVKINGRAIDYLNRHVASKNETPERLRLAIPPGTLHAGENRVDFEEIGKKADPDDLDDLGILGIALEFAPARHTPDAPRTPRP